MSVRRKTRRFLGMAAAIAASSAVAMLAVAAVKPQPPPKLCIGASCVTGPASGNIKWHPGHYVWVSGPGYSPNVQAATAALLDSISNDAQIAGVQIIFKWAELEGPKAGDYSGGFALIDSLLGKLGSMKTPKRLIISIQERTFGQGRDSVPGGVYPQYVIDSGGVILAPVGSRWAGTLQSIAKLDQPAVMDRMIALTNAYGHRYDSNPLVEMIAPMGELAVSASAGIVSADYLTQVKRLYAAAAAAWPTTLVRWQLNFAPGDSNDSAMLSLLAQAKTQPQSIIGGPDPEVPLPLPASYPAGARTIQGNRVFRGLKSGSGNQVVYEDLRGKLPWVGEYQGGPRLGAGDVLPGDFGDYEVNVMHASHLIYCYNTWAPSGTPPSDPHKWAAQRAYIDATQGATFAGITAPGN